MKNTPRKSNPLSFTPEHVAAHYKAEFGAAPDNIMTPAQAQAWADAFALVNPSEKAEKYFHEHKGFFFIPAASACAWLSSLPVSAVLRVIDREALSGWFVEQCAEEMENADEDGDFISTPCYSSGDSFPNMLDMVNDVSRSGLIILESPTRWRGVCSGIKQS